MAVGIIALSARVAQYYPNTSPAKSLSKAVRAGDQVYVSGQIGLRAAEIIAEGRVLAVIVSHSK